MTTTKIEIQNLINNLNKIDEYDYIEIEDNNHLKGILISEKLSKTFKKYLQENETQKKLEALKKFSGTGTGLFENLSIQKIKSQNV